MKTTVPLCYTRIWCRANQAWLSFKTAKAERFLVSPEGYFLELPDGSLSRISPRTAFPLVDRLPSIDLSELTVRKQFGDTAYFVSVPLKTTERAMPAPVALDEV